MSLASKTALVVSVLVPLALAVPASRLLCACLAQYAAAHLSDASDWLHGAAAAQAPPVADGALPHDSDASAKSVERDIVGDADAKPRSKGAKDTRADSSKKLRGILVRRATVLSAVRRGLRPSAAFVSETSQHPAGLLVHGWGGAGAGLYDGDIITRIGGHRPSSVEDVVAVVISAYRKKVYAVSGTIYREGQEIRTTVELPIPDGPAEEER